MQSRTNTTLPAFLYTYDEGKNEIQGSPYRHEEWLEGKVFFEDDTVATRMRYHVMNDDLIVVHPQLRQHYLVDNSAVMGFLWYYQGLEQPFVRLENVLPELGMSGFWEVLHQGEVWLLAKYRKQFLKADYKDPFGAGRTGDRITDSPTQFMLYDEENKQLFKKWKGSDSDWKKLLGKASFERIKDIPDRNTPLGMQAALRRAKK